MARKGENIYKRKDGRWEGRYLKYIPGQKPRYGYVYAQTYRETREKLIQAAAQWRSQPTQPQASPQRYLADVAHAWLQHTIPLVKQSTSVKYHTILRKHLLPALGSLPLEALTYQRLEAFSQTLLQFLSPRTVADILTVLRSILRFAVREGEHVPCDGRDLQIRRPAYETQVLSTEGQSILCRHILSNLNGRNAGILLSLCTGLRVGEVCALRWDDISLQDQLLHVRRTMQRVQNLSPEGPRTLIIETPPKTISSARTIPLPEDLVRVLCLLPGPHTGYFLTGEEGSFVEPRLMQYHLSHVTHELGLVHIKYHALRHTFATRCIERGFDAKSLSELLGHATIAMTLNRYVHPTIEHKRSHMQRLGIPMTAVVTAKRHPLQNLLQM